MRRAAVPSCAPLLLRVVQAGLLGGLGLALLVVFIAPPHRPVLVPPLLSLALIVLGLSLLAGSGVWAGVTLPPLRTDRSAFLRMGGLWWATVLLSGLNFGIGLMLVVKLLLRALL